MGKIKRKILMLKGFKGGWKFIHKICGKDVENLRYEI